MLYYRLAYQQLPSERRRRIEPKILHLLLAAKRKFRVGYEAVAWLHIWAVPPAPRNSASHYTQSRRFSRLDYNITYLHRGWG